MLAEPETVAELSAFHVTGSVDPSPIGEGTLSGRTHVLLALSLTLPLV